MDQAIIGTSVSNLNPYAASGAYITAAIWAQSIDSLSFSDAQSENYGKKYSRFLPILFADENHNAFDSGTLLTFKYTSFLSIPSKKNSFKSGV